MKRLFKKNQVIITALAIMIAVAGYLNFTDDGQMLNTSVEDMQSEGASGNSDDNTVSAAVDDSIEGEELANAEIAEDVDTSVTVSDSDNTDEVASADAVDTETLEEGVVSDEEGEEYAEASLDENGDPIDSETVGEAVLTNASVSLSQAKLNREQTRSKAKEMLLEIINNENLSEEAKQEAVDKMIAMTEQMEKESAAETQLAAKGFSDAIVNISEDSVDVTLSINSLTDTQRTQIEDIIMRKTGCELQDIVITTTQN